MNSYILQTGHCLISKLAKFYQIFPVFPIENATYKYALTRIYHPGINLPLKQAVQSVRPIFAKRSIVKVILAKAWAMAVFMG
jgi:hypothetical protein